MVAGGRRLRGRRGTFVWRTGRRSYWQHTNNNYSKDKLYERRLYLRLFSARSFVCVGPVRGRLIGDCWTGFSGFGITFEKFALCIRVDSCLKIGLDTDLTFLT